MTVTGHMKRRRRLRGLDEMPVPNPRDAQWRRPLGAGRRLKQAAVIAAIAYGVVGALVLTALLSRHGSGTVLAFMGDTAAASWRWLTILAREAT